MIEVSDLIERVRDERRSRGHLYSGMRFKRALVERVGAEAAFPLAVPELGVPGLQTLRRRAVRALRDVARTDGLPYRELWPGGTPHLVPTPTVLGEHDDVPRAVTDRCAFLACLDDVLVRGQSGVLLRGDEALVDAERDEYRPAQDSAEFDPAVLQSGDDAFWTMEPGGNVPRLPEALKLCGAYASDFGHWLYDFLPRLAIARLAGWRGGMPVLVDRNIPATIRDALPRLLPPDAPLVTVPHMAPVRVDRLWCVPSPSYIGFFPADRIALADQTRWLPVPQRMATLLREVGTMTAEATAEPTGIARLYLGRKAHRRKRMVNQEQVQAVLDRHRFHSVFPEDLGFIEQLRLVRHARHIVAPEGSNSLLSWLARPGAKACVLGPPSIYTLAADCATLAALGIEPTLITGPGATDSPGFSDDPSWTFWNDYRIDAAAFDDFLRRWLDLPPAAPQ